MDDAAILEDHGIRASAHRVAIARVVLHTGDHPSADEVWDRVREAFPHVSRATVYNTLATFEQHGLVVRLCLGEDHAVFDANVSAHHHFVDDETGAISDVPWEAVEVNVKEAPRGASISSVSVVLRGRAAR